MARRLVFALLVTLLLLEIALRAVFPVPAVTNFDRAAYAPLGVVPDPNAPPSLAHASFTWASDPDGFEFVHRLNLHGFRDGEWRLTPPRRATRVAFFGDSFVEGFSTDDAGTIPALFEGLAADAGLELDVLNLGVGGAGLAAYARLLRDAVPLLRPRDAILVLYANDVIPLRFEPAWLEAPLEPGRASAWTPRGVHVLRRFSRGLPVPRRWHAAPVPFLPPAPDPRNPWSDGRRAGQLGAFVARDIARAIREGRFNPSLTNFLGWYRMNLARPADLAPHLRALDAYVRRHGARLWLAYVPTKNQVSDRYLPFQARYLRAETVQSLLGPEYQQHAAALAEACADLGVSFLDLTPALRAAEPTNGPLYWDYDDHLRPAGYRLVAERLLGWWREGRGAE